MLREKRRVWWFCRTFRLVVKLVLSNTCYRLKWINSIPSFVIPLWYEQSSTPFLHFIFSVLIFADDLPLNEFYAFEIPLHYILTHVLNFPFIFKRCNLLNVTSLIFICYFHFHFIFSLKFVDDFPLCFRFHFRILVRNCPFIFKKVPFCHTSLIFAHHFHFIFSSKIRWRFPFTLYYNTRTSSLFYFQFKIRGWFPFTLFFNTRTQFLFCFQF